MNASRVFTTLTDDELSEIALSIISGTIGREDFCRICKWLIEGIRLCDCEADGTLVLIAGLNGPVTKTQLKLLQVALFKWIGVIQTFILDTQNNMHLAATNPRQETLPLSLD